MRLFYLVLALLAAALSVTIAPAQQPRDWRTHVVQAPSGAFQIGNPAAKVKLVEYLSYSCSHCAHFAAESKAALHDDLVRRGVVRVEVRHAIRDPLDLTAALLARCSGPQRFAASSEAIFATQATWYSRGASWWQGNAATLQSQPERVRLRRVATASGLAALMQRQGMSAARIDQCFATATDLDRLTAMADAAWQAIRGTPSFTVNGAPVDGSDWPSLEPRLRAAGAN